MKFKTLASLAFVLSFLLLASLCFVNAQEQVAANPCSPTIQIVNQDPIPAIPGDYVKVVFELDGLVNCNGYAVKLNPQYPFSLDPGSEQIQTIGGGSYVADFKNTWMVPYKIRVADNALEGDYNLKLDYHEGASTNFESAFESNFNLTVTDSQTDFDVVMQDVTGQQVSLGVVNTGKNLANSLVVSIPKQDGFTVTGASKQILGNLAAGDYSTVAFNIASTNRVPGNFTRPSGGFNYTSNFNRTSMNIQSPMLQVQMDYTDGIGKRRTIVKNISADMLISPGNFTRTGTATGRIVATSTAKTSSISIWWYILGAAIVIIILVRYREPIWSKLKSIKFRGFKKKDSRNDPDWVSAERKSRKK